jgi:Outer membrane protein
LKGITRYLVLCVASVLAAPVTSQDLRVAFVNVVKVLQQAPQAQAALNKLKQEFAPRDQELLKQQKVLRTLEDKLSRDAAIMSDSERLKLEREILSSQREIKRAQDEFREDFNSRRNDELSRLQSRVYEAIVSLAKKEKYDLVVGDVAVIFANDRLDITDSVLERLRQEYKASGSNNN